MSRLDELLAAEGYTHRAPQDRLYEHLLSPESGVIAQAGTGVGKSIAVLAAAADARERTGIQSLIVTPTRVLMDQYMAHDAPLAGKVFDMEVAELRGRVHYFCEYTKGLMDLANLEYDSGCEGSDGGCTVTNWRDSGYRCDYQQAKADAAVADIVVTNTDMLIVNDRMLAPFGGNFFELGGGLFVDEAHQLEPKMRDFAARSLPAHRLDRFNYAGAAGPALAKWVRSRGNGVDVVTVQPSPAKALHAIATCSLPEGSKSRRPKEIQDAAARILAGIENPNDAQVLYVQDEAIKLDWTNVSPSARALLTGRPYALVSATIPKTMSQTLGVPEARFIDVGHPFDYGRQATLSISKHAGDFRSVTPETTKARAQEVLDLVKRNPGGSLLLFSAFRDMEEVRGLIEPALKAEGRTVLVQGGDIDNDELGRKFKADGRAVLFGSASFATGFDVPGDALKMVVLWKLPYPGSDPVTNRIRSQSWPRYNDIMAVTAVQSIGRLIRRDTDIGHVHIADSRGERLLNAADPLTSHLVEFRQISL